MKNILVFGGGGHAKVVMECVEKAGGLKILAVVVRSPEEAAEIQGYPALTWEEARKKHACGAGIIAVGENFLRKRLAQEILQAHAGFEFVSAIHPSAQISASAQIGAGTAVMAGACVNADARIGAHCVLNTRAVIEHDCRIGDFSSVGPGANLGGAVELGPEAFIGLGASVIQRLRVGSGTLLGAGSLLLESLPAGVLAYGHPAKIIRKRASDEPIFSTPKKQD